MKPKIMKPIKDKEWIDGDCETLKYQYLGFGDNNGTAFSRFHGVAIATMDKHHLLQCPPVFKNTSYSQMDLNGTNETFVLNRSYCSGVKMCAHEGCTYTVSTKQKINRCSEHNSMGLSATGPCTCHVAYIFRKNIEQDGRHWFIALNSGSSDGIHNHPPPSERKALPKVLSNISNVISRNTSISPKELQKGCRMDYRSMETPLPTASLARHH